MANEIILNTTFLLRRDDFTAENKKTYKLLEGEPGYCTVTKVFKVGDGNTTWENLGFANEDEVEKIIENYYTKDEVDELLAAEKKAREDADTANNDRVKAVEDELDTYGDIVTHNVAEFQPVGNYQPAGNYKTKTTEEKTDTGATSKTIISLSQSTNGDITATFTDIQIETSQINNLTEGLQLNSEYLTLTEPDKALTLSNDFITSINTISNTRINRTNNNTNNERNNRSHSTNIIRNINNINTNNNQHSAIPISDSFSHLLQPSNFNYYSSYENITQNINNIRTLLSNESSSNITKTLFTISN
jgi:hypothetical protein